MVNQHFGRAEVFYIGEVNDRDEFRLLEERKTEAVCKGGDHEADVLERAANSLSDCRYVLVSQIGPGAEGVLNRKGITVLSVRHYIAEAVKCLIEYDKRLNSLFPE